MTSAYHFPMQLEQSYQTVPNPNRRAPPPTIHSFPLSPPPPPQLTGPLAPLQALEFLGCIRKFHFERPGAASLFSKPAREEVITGGKLSDAPAAFYEPAIDCTLKMGRVFPYELNWNKWGAGAPL